MIRMPSIPSRSMKSMNRKPKRFEAFSNKVDSKRIGQQVKRIGTKSKWNVFIRMNVCNFGIWTTGEWEFLGSTLAVSEAQARNNLRHRIGEHTLECGPVLDSDWQNYEYELKAERG